MFESRLNNKADWIDLVLPSIQNDLTYTGEINSWIDHLLTSVSYYPPQELAFLVIRGTSQKECFRHDTAPDYEATLFSMLMCILEIKTMELALQGLTPERRLFYMQNDREELLNYFNRDLPPKALRGFSDTRSKMCLFLNQEFGASVSSVSLENCNTDAQGKLKFLMGVFRHLEQFFPTFDFIQRIRFKMGSCSTRNFIEKR